MLGQATVYPILEESKSSILNIIRPGDLPLGNGVVDMLTLFCFISLNSFILRMSVTRTTACEVLGRKVFQIRIVDPRIEDALKESKLSADRHAPEDF
jgi:hypothetical protein